VKTKVFFVLVMLAMLASLVVPFATPALALGAESPPGANASGLNMNLGVIPTVAHDGDTLSYFITISNNPSVLPLISADAQNIVVTFAPPDATGNPGAPVTIATIPSLLVGQSVSFNPGNTPALSVVLALNPGVTVAYGEAHFSATLLTDPVSVATDTKDIPTIILTPCIEVTKTANPTTSKAGDVVTYTIEVCNCGDATLSDVEVDDSLLGDLSGSFADSLAIGACESHDFDRTVLATDPDPLENTVEACGDDVTGFEVCDEDSAEVDLVHPCMSVTKTVNPTVSKPGDVVTYTICITNCGDVTLEGLTVVDSLMGPLAFPTTIDAGEEICLDFPYTIPADALDPMENCVEVHANPLGPMTNDIVPNPATSELCAEVDLVHPDISVTKTADPTTAHVGDTITYTIEVCNSGDIALEGVTVVDSLLGDLSGSFADTLAVGACESHDFTRVILETDPNPLDNTVVVHGNPLGPLTNDVTDSDSAEVNIIAPCIEVTKTANPTTSKAGDVVTYTIEVCNCGTTTLTSVTVDDSLLGDLSGSFADSLAAGACESHDFDRTVLATDPDPVENTVEACGDDPLGLQVCDEDSASVDLVSPCLSVIKTVNPTVSKPGDVVTYTICVTNCGDIDLENLSLVDSLMGTLDFPSTIAAGDEICVDFPYTIPADASDPMRNCLTVHANPVGMTNDIVPDPATSELCAEVDLVNPAICVTKTANPTEGEPGDTITYTINVCNCGDIALENVYVIDDMLGNLSASYADTLAVGACESHDFTRVILETDPQMLQNCVDVYGEPVGPLTNEVTDRDCAHVNVIKPARCRITGGGTIGSDREPRVTHGFELHCNANQLPNRLEVNWGGQ